MLFVNCDILNTGCSISSLDASLTGILPASTNVFSLSTSSACKLKALRWELINLARLWEPGGGSTASPRRWGGAVWVIWAFAVSHRSLLAVLRGNKVEDQSIVGNYAVLPGTYLPSPYSITSQKNCNFRNTVWRPQIWTLNLFNAGHWKAGQIEV